MNQGRISVVTSEEPQAEKRGIRPGFLKSVFICVYQRLMLNSGIRRRTSSASPGFTLLELLVVVAIIGLLVGYVAPRYFGQIGKSEVNAAKAQIDALEKALDQYRLDTGRYPATELGLNALLQRPQNEPKWNGPYLKKAVPPDPWGKPYVYRAPGEKGDFDLISYGKDGAPGGTGENADITNH
jgi:general secretion pathway protein G